MALLVVSGDNGEQGIPPVPQWEGGVMPKRAIEPFGFANDKEDGNIYVNDEDVYADDHPYVRRFPSRFRDIYDGVNVIDAPVKKARAV